MVRMGKIVSTIICSAQRWVLSTLPFILGGGSEEVEYRSLPLGPSDIDRKGVEMTAESEVV